MSRFDPARVSKRRAKHNTTRTCKGKVRYRDQREAIAALHRLSQSAREVSPARVYECPTCHGYHTTSRKTA